MSKDVKVVIGANFGDEGKGLATDYFAEQERIANRNCIVVLPNGGSQRTHTVSTTNGKRHVFRHFGSGSFAWAATYLPKQFIIHRPRKPSTFRRWDEWAKSVKHLEHGLDII